MNNSVILINKKSTQYGITYPYTRLDGQMKNTWVWQGSVGGRYFENEIPMDVYDWLVNNTTAIKNGSLVLKNPIDVNKEEFTEEEQEKLENYEIAKDSAEVVGIDVEKIDGAIKSKAELEEIFKCKGNGNVLKGKLNKLIEGIEDEHTISTIKKYVLRVAKELKLDSNNKNKAICDWCGVNYEEMRDVFNAEI